MSTDVPIFFKTLEEQLKKEAEPVLDLAKIGFGNIISKKEEAT